MKGFINFVSSRTFLIQIGLAFVVTLVLIFITLKQLDLYTHHGERITVPNLVEKKIDEAKKIIKDKNLSFIIIDSLFDRDAQPGTIIEQFPNGGQEVKRHRQIRLTVTTLVSPKIIINQVKDFSLRQAISHINKKGLLIEKLEYKNSEYINLVLGIQYKGEQLKKGTELHKGDEVVIIVGKDSTVNFKVPDLIGLSANYAKRKALEAGINIGKVVFQNTNDKKNARVSEQSIKANTEVKPGSNVNIFLKAP